VHGQADADRHPSAGDLLQHLQIDLIRLAGTAVLLRVGQAEQAGLAECAERGSWEHLGLLGLGRIRP
jgi:hypothetical protein